MWKSLYSIEYNIRLNVKLWERENNVTNVREIIVM